MGTGHRQRIAGAAANGVSNHFGDSTQGKLMLLDDDFKGRRTAAGRLAQEAVGGQADHGTRSSAGVQLHRRAACR